MSRPRPRAPRARSFALLLPLALLPCACASAGDGGNGGAAGHGLGAVPRDLVELYDRARPGGVIELEIDRDGTIREMEAEVPLDAVPQAVLDAARERFPDGRITGAEREITQEGAGWEVKLQHQGRNVELIYSNDGRLLEFEREIDRGEAPQAVMQAADRAFPGARLRSVEIVEHLDRALYHVKYEREGAMYKVIVSPEGRVTRRVREQPAEIEIPLADGM